MNKKSIIFIASILLLSLVALSILIVYFKIPDPVEGSYLRSTQEITEGSDFMYLYYAAQRCIQENNIATYKSANEMTQLITGGNTKKCNYMLDEPRLVWEKGDVFRDAKYDFAFSVLFDGRKVIVTKILQP